MRSVGWRDLLPRGDEIVVAPWTGGRTLRTRGGTFRLAARPPEHGWYSFRVSGRDASSPVPADPDVDALAGRVRGFLAGDRILPDDLPRAPDVAGILAASHRVLLLDPGIERFSRVSAGYHVDGGPLLFAGLEMPTGPEADVLSAFLDRRPDVRDVPGVTPALEAAFRFESHVRDQREALERAEAERRRLEDLRRSVATGEGRRALALQDFPAAARAALSISGAEMLDARDGARRGEHVVTFRFIGRRFQCVCTTDMHVLDAGICLTGEDGVRGDSFFTLESLPGVIQEADEQEVLHVTRHA